MYVSAIRPPARPTSYSIYSYAQRNHPTQQQHQHTVVTNSHPSHAVHERASDSWFEEPVDLVENRHELGLDLVDSYFLLIGEVVVAELAVVEDADDGGGNG